jgi:predicted DNA-binding protein
MTTLRLNREIEYKLHKLAKIESRTKSDIIKELIVNYLDGYEKSKKTPYELGMQYFGKVKTGNKNGSVEYKSIILKKIRAKHHKK